jgi:hypothetical protein
MVRIKFSACPRVPVGSPSPSPMASEDVGAVYAALKESLTERLDVALVSEKPMTSTEITSEHDAGSDESDASGDTDDGGNALDNGDRVKIGAEAALAGISFDFGRSKVTRGRISDLKSSFHFFPKGFAQTPGIESVPVPKGDEVVVFEDFSLLTFAYLRTMCF